MHLFSMLLHLSALVAVKFICSFNYCIEILLSNVNFSVFVCLFMYTALVISDYYYRDSELSCNRWIRFQSAPPKEGAGVFNVPEGGSLRT